MRRVYAYLLKQRRLDKDVVNAFVKANMLYANMLYEELKYMGKDLKGKELGEGIYQQPNGTYCARMVDRFGKRRVKRTKKLQEVRQWLADATYIDEHSDIEHATKMTVDAWFDYWIDMKKKTVRPNTVRNYTERYHQNIKKSNRKEVVGRRKADSYYRLDFVQGNWLVLCGKILTSKNGH